MICDPTEDLFESCNIRRVKHLLRKNLTDPKPNGSCLRPRRAARLRAGICVDAQAMDALNFQSVHNSANVDIETL